MKGRVVDEDGKPVAETALSFASVQNSRPDEVTGFWHKDQAIRTDKAGRFEVQGLVPGSPYALVMGTAKGQQALLLEIRADWKAGETKDLGDLKRPSP
jgi:hypothetical protein